ncbi:hypothetical protein NVP1151O_49 [Vibrio phage 1.151.O._10N.222.46.B1]|nr:hypothetical protein NVP1151O_49 [Vibrio phage 1.151.O._10N.222.46.B1]
MKAKLIGLCLLAALGTATVHEVAWAESKCAELKNTPQECALLSSESL